MATLLTQHELDGEQVVTLVNHKLPEYGEDPEGRAIIREVHQGDRAGVLATVQFIDGEYINERHDLWVFASDQEMEEGTAPFDRPEPHITF